MHEQEWKISGIILVVVITAVLFAPAVPSIADESGLHVSTDERREMRSHFRSFDRHEFGIFIGMARKGSAVSWAVEYELMLRNIARYGPIVFDASFGYINEGHPEGSHRDGFLAQVWAGKEIGSARISAGAGPYLFNDRHAGVENNRVGGMFSADVDYRFSPRFSAGLRLNQTAIHEDINSTSLLARLSVGSSEEEGIDGKRNQVSLFVGLDSDTTLIGKYSRELPGDFHNFKIAATGVMKNGEAEGAAVELCLINHFGKQSQIDVCLGPYYDIKDSAFAAIVELAFEYRFRKYPFSLMINHVRTSNLSSSKDRGLDELGMLGVGYRF